MGISFIWLSISRLFDFLLDIYCFELFKIQEHELCVLLDKVITRSLEQMIESAILKHSIQIKEILSQFESNRIDEDETCSSPTMLSKKHIFHNNVTKSSRFHPKLHSSMVDHVRNDDNVREFVTLLPCVIV